MALFWAPRGSKLQLGIAPRTAPSRDSAGRVRPAQGLTMIVFAPKPELGDGGFYETDDPAEILLIQQTRAWDFKKIRPWGNKPIVVSAPAGALLTCDVETVSGVLAGLPGMPISAEPDLDGSFEMPEVAT